MILSTASPLLHGGLPLVAAGVAVAGYAVSAALARGATLALVAGWLAHMVVLVLDIGGWGTPLPGARLGFAPVLSMAAWLVIAVYTVESRLVPLPAVRRGLALAGAGTVLLALAFPGEPRQHASALAPLHFALGVGSYALFGAAVLHALLLDAADRRLRGRRGAAPGGALGMPLLQIERLTFRFVNAGFVLLSATLLVAFVFSESLYGRGTAVKWDHKTVFSVLSWITFAALLLGRARFGWRGPRAARVLYVGAGLLLLAYVGSRFVLEVVLGRIA